MVETTTVSTKDLQKKKEYKVYDAVILSDEEQLHLFGKMLSFRIGFVAEDRIDWKIIYRDLLFQ